MYSHKFFFYFLNKFFLIYLYFFRDNEEKKCIFNFRLAPYSEKLANNFKMIPKCFQNFENHFGLSGKIRKNSTKKTVEIY
jgi:hypothetical protein